MPVRVPDLVTELNRPWLPDAVEGFLGSRPSEDLAPGRQALLAWVVDRDLGCGELTTALGLGDTEVSWSDFLWEDGIHDPRPVDQLDQPIIFDRNQYEAAFVDACMRVAGFPYDDLAITDAGSAGPGNGDGS